MEQTKNIQKLNIDSSMDRQHDTTARKPTTNTQWKERFHEYTEPIVVTKQQSFIKIQSWNC